MGLNVLLLGTLISKEQSDLFASLGVRPAPADIVQEYLIDGLCVNEKVDTVDAVCSPRIMAYPKSKIWKVSDNAFRFREAEVKSLGFINAPVFGFAQREQRIVSEAKKWARRQSGDVMVLLYSMHSPFLKAAKSVKKILPSAKVFLIIPDLPQYMQSGGTVKRILKKIDRKRIDRLLPVVDKYILYTKQMAEYFGLEDGSWMVCEGLMDVSKISTENNEPSDGKRICMYAGSFASQYALDTLVAAFERACVDAELHLYGNPAEGEALISKFPNCKKTRYMGILSQSEVFERMKEATLLVNPRPSNLELAKYSCPSKTFEYMASGTPVLMTRLPGLPEEYHSYLYFFEEETEDGFKDTLEKVLSKDSAELRAKGTEACNFLKNEKSSVRQVQRIVDFY